MQARQILMESAFASGTGAPRAREPLGTLAVDTALVDSSIAGYRLDGQEAPRALGRIEPRLRPAVGGFHLQATTPTGFPALRHVGIDRSGSACRASISALPHEQDSSPTTDDGAEPPFRPG